MNLLKTSGSVKANVRIVCTSFLWRKLEPIPVTNAPSRDTITVGKSGIRGVRITQEMIVHAPGISARQHPTSAEMESSAFHGRSLRYMSKNLSATTVLTENGIDMSESYSG